MAVTNFFDDFKIHDLVRGLCAGPCFRELVSTVGGRLDPEKSTALSEEVLFLGVWENYSDLAGGRELIRVKPKPENCSSQAAV